MSEIARLRKAQAKAVMPVIGPLLDAWDALPNDVALMEELEDFSTWIEELKDAMDAGGPE